MKPIICIHGKNGSGKTNLLDAIYYLGFTKSYFAKKEANIVQHGKQGMYVKGTFVNDHEENINVKIIIRETGKKELWQNEEEIKLLNKFIGQFPSIMISPDDVELVTEGGEHRRKYFDSILCQTNMDYFSKLMLYNKLLIQRNALLKNWFEIGHDQQQLITYYNEQMSSLGQYIHEKRRSLLQDLIIIIQDLFIEISNESEEIIIKYDSKLAATNLMELLNNNIEKDIASKRTNYGIHKDDLIFSTKDGNNFKDYASQGQRKTLLFALKIAQFKYLKTSLKVNPILLLDDVFEKLDEHRSQHLLDLVLKENCQTFITDTHLDRLKKAFEGNLDKVDFLEIT